MSESTNGQQTVVRTGRGLSVAGTRITLYSIVDYLKAGWPPKLVQDWLNLSDAQMADILAYLESHRDEVESEYQKVVQQAEETRHYWETRNRARAVHPPETTPQKDALRAKLKEWKDELDRT